MPQHGKSRKKKAKRQRSPTLAEELTWHRVLEALNLMRVHGLSLTQAAWEAGTTPRTMKKYLGGALMKAEDGRYVPSAYSGAS